MPSPRGSLVVLSIVAACSQQSGIKGSEAWQAPGTTSDAAVVDGALPGCSGTGWVADCTLQSDGLERTFAYFAPKDAASNTPLVFFLHGSGGFNPQAGEWRKFARAESFYLMVPSGYDIPGTGQVGTGVWNGGDNGAPASMSRSNTDPRPIDDSQFVSDLIDWALERYPNIDPDRIYATGVSNGGFFTFRLGCELADRLAAVAPMRGAGPAYYRNYEISASELDQVACEAANSQCESITNPGPCTRETGQDGTDAACVWRPGPNPGCESQFVWHDDGYCARRFYAYLAAEDDEPVVRSRTTVASGLSYDCDLPGIPTLIEIGGKDPKVYGRGAVSSMGHVASVTDNLQHALHINGCFADEPPNLMDGADLPEPDVVVSHDCPYNPECSSAAAEGECLGLDGCQWAGRCHSICDGLGVCAGPAGCEQLHGYPSRCINADGDPELPDDCVYQKNEAYCTDCRDVLEESFCDGRVVQVTNQGGGHCKMISTDDCAVAEFDDGSPVTEHEVAWSFFMRHRRGD